jgi:hypothetical protein
MTNTSTLTRLIPEPQALTCPSCGHAMPTASPRAGVAKKILIGALTGLSLLYLINPGAGFFELIPDNLPLVGNLDEAAAAALLMAGLRYFGLDLSPFRRR